MTAPRYSQPRRLEVPFKVLIVRADPDFEQRRRKEVFYEFTGRKFTGNNMTAGAYAPEQENV